MYYGLEHVLVLLSQCFGDDSTGLEKSGPGQLCLVGRSSSVRLPLKPEPQWVIITASDYTSLNASMLCYETRLSP